MRDTQRPSRAEVESVAEAARLGLQDGEWEEYADALARVDAITHTWRQLPLDDVEPTITPSDVQDVLRSDAVRPSLSQEAVLHNAPATDEGCFWVPRILEE